MAMNQDFTRTLRTAGFAVAVGISLLGMAGTSNAQEFTAEQRAACSPDAFRLCSSEIPNVPAIAACMRKHRSSLSVACKAVFPK